MGLANTKRHSVIRYSPKPLSEYYAMSAGAKYGPATSRFLVEPEAWNLAYLSFNFDDHILHPDPLFTSYVRRTLQVRLDGSGPDLAGTADPTTLVKSLLLLPAPRFVYLVRQLPVYSQLPMFTNYGDEWFETIVKRSYECQVDAHPHNRDVALHETSADLGRTVWAASLLSEVLAKASRR